MNEIDPKKSSLFQKWLKIDAIVDEQISSEIIFPENFSFKNNFKKSFEKIKEVNSAIFQNTGKGTIVTLDFSKTKKADTSAFFVLQVMKLEMILDLKKLCKKKKGTPELPPNITIIPSGSANINRLLSIMGIIKIGSPTINVVEDDSNLHPINNTGYLKGTRLRKYGMVTKVTDKVVSYLNGCLNHHGYKFTTDEINYMSIAIGEILDNAEDHCQFGKWYITANFSKERKKAKSEHLVGEINLSILNFGGSIYERYVDTKDKNHLQFTAVMKTVNELLSENKDGGYSEEQYFTAMIMRDQISRLKYEGESRGVGTSSFINALFELGDYADIEKGYFPTISLLSGKTSLNLDHNCIKPNSEDISGISLNKKNNILIPLEIPYMEQLDVKFPGTIIGAKIYFNTEHFNNKYGGNHERN